MRWFRYKFLKIYRYCSVLQGEWSWMLVPDVWTPQAFRPGGVERGHLVTRSGVQRWDTWTGTSQGWGHLWVWSLACCSGFPLKGETSSFLLHSQGTKRGCSLGWTHSCWCASINLSFLGSVSGKIPELLVFPESLRFSGNSSESTWREKVRTPPDSAGALWARGGWGTSWAWMETACSHFVMDT